MDELQKLQNEFMKLQHQQVAQQLSDRVCADIMIKLIQSKKLNVFFTTDGKEYVTPQQLKREILDELYVQKGRLNISDLQTVLNVDIHHIEVHSREIALKDPTIHYDSGELLTEYYFDRIGEEIEESLQEVGQLNIADLAKRFSLPTEMLIGVIEKRLESNVHAKKKKSVIIRGRLEPPLLFTQTFVERHEALIRGLFSSITVPTPVYHLIHSHHFHESLFDSIMEDMISKGRILGTLQGRLDKTVYIPKIYSQNRIKSIDQFFSQNGFIEYQTLQKLQVSEPIKYLKQRFPSGHALTTCYLSDHEFLQVDDAISDALSRNEWIDVQPLVPSPLSFDDINSLINSAPSFAKGGHHLILNDSVILSNGFVNNLLTKFNEYFLETAKSNPSSLTTSTSKLRSSSSSSSALKSSSDRHQLEASSDSQSQDGDEDEDDIPQSKKKGRSKKSKKKSSSSSSTPLRKSTSDSFDFPELEKCIMKWYEEFPVALCQPVLVEIKSKLEVMRDEASKILFNNSEAKKKLDANEWQSELSKLFWNIELFIKSLPLFPQSERVEVEKYILKTMGAESVNLLIEVSATQCDVNLDIPVSSPADRLSALKKLSKHPKIANQLASLNKSLTEDYAKFNELLMDVADIAGVRLKKLDKRSERQLVETHHQLYKTQLENEENPANVYHIAVLFLFTSKTALVTSVPPKLISSVLEMTKEYLNSELYEEIFQFGQTVKEYLTAKIKKQNAQADEFCLKLTNNIHHFKEQILLNSVLKQQ